MALQLRQIALVARELEPVLQDLTAIFGIERCFIDPGVGVFGLENTLMPVGRNFIEVVAPVQENTAAGRYLDRRQGDGGYMVILHADSKDTQARVIEQAAANKVRIAHEIEHGDWHVVQFHPGDLQASFIDVETDAQNDFQGTWHAAGGDGWQDKVRQDVTVDFTGVELQSPDPLALAELWARVLGSEVERLDQAYGVALNNAILRFVQSRDDRGPGLVGVDVDVKDLQHVLAAARERDCYVNDGQVEVCGVRWYLNQV